jgi:hypothetical protein
VARAGKSIAINESIEATLDELREYVRDNIEKN